MAEVSLPKLDVSKDMSLEKCEERLSSYLLGAVTKKDDSALIANAILKGKVMSDKNHASLVTVSIDMTGILDLLKDQLSATLQTYAHGTANSCNIDNLKSSWSQDNTRADWADAQTPDDQPQVIHHSIYEWTAINS